MIRGHRRARGMHPLEAAPCGVTRGIEKSSWTVMRSGQNERLEVVETGRRPRWSKDEKLKIVLESLQAPRQVAATEIRGGGAKQGKPRLCRERAFAVDADDRAAPRCCSACTRQWTRDRRRIGIAPRETNANSIRTGCSEAVSL